MTRDSIPTLGKPSFKCPHCGAISHQIWHRLRPEVCDKNSLFGVNFLNKFLKESQSKNTNLAQNRKISEFLVNFNSGKPFFTADIGVPNNFILTNVHLSQCYSCDEISIWLSDRLLHPASEFTIEPNSDLPDDISPRGSAALLRLCVQKICKNLGKSGDNINSDIAELVRNGLDTRIQQALDIVRVIGNNAVHPGKIDMADDRETAFRLFGLVNQIAMEMITKPKEIDEFYKKLPESSISAIEKRDREKPKI